MSIKKFTEFSLKENKEDKEDKMEDKIEDIKNAHEEVTSNEEEIPFDSDLSDVGEEADEEDESTDSNLSDYNDFSNYEKEPKIEAVLNNESNVSTGTKIVIINGCEPDSEIDKKTEDFKSKCGVDCKEIFLYQLNIQSPKKQEPKDGMQQIYDEIENAHAIIFACAVNKGKLSDTMETAISRIKTYYKKEELKNKIFGAIIIGNEDKVKNDLILTALNDFHMVVCADCLCFCNDKSSSNLNKMMDSITTLSNATALIKSNLDEVEVEKSESDIKPYDEYVDSEQIEDPTEAGLPEDEGSETESDDYVDSLKSGLDLSIDAEDVEDEDEDSEEESENEGSTEEEERLIDNEDGTITQIHRGVKVTENKEVSENFDIIPFDIFNKKKK